jgi:maltooligosyltrehalose trehalohydrolase
LADGSVEFSVWAPTARTVRLCLGRSSHGRILTLDPLGNGSFRGVSQAEPGTDYVFLLDENPPRPDPVSRHRPAGVHGPSRIVDPAAFTWSTPGWKGISTAELVIYELHVGTFTPQGTFESTLERLPQLRQLGVTAVEIMPVAEFPGGRNWGYDGVSLYAPQSTYGGPAGFRTLVDACHQEGLAVILDVVYNHLGPEGNYLPDFGPYFSQRHRTPWGEGWNLDGPESEQVRGYLVDNALYWITEFRVDGLRLDAADEIADSSPLHILEEIVAGVQTQAAVLGRRVNLIAESDANDPRFIRPARLGGLGFDAQWNDDFHHAVHAALTGERQGYFADLGGVGPVARASSGRLVADLPSDRFVVCIQNHDQVGNRAGGERLATLISPAALRLGAAVLLLSPYVPMLFMGEEYGETNPFLYFVSHGDPDLVQAVREGRRREFARFGWTGEALDPQAESSFHRSCLDWERAAKPDHAGLRMLYGDLLRLRRSEAALLPGAAQVSVSQREDEGWVAVQLTARGNSLLAGFNFDRSARSVPLVSSNRYHLLLTTDHRQYGGSDSTQLKSRRVVLPPLSAAVLKENRE